VSAEDLDEKRTKHRKKEKEDDEKIHKDERKMWKNTFQRIKLFGGNQEVSKRKVNKGENIEKSRRFEEKMKKTIKSKNTVVSIEVLRKKGMLKKNHGKV
jgi:leucyl aminopeptidase